MNDSKSILTDKNIKHNIINSNASTMFARESLLLYEDKLGTNIRRLDVAAYTYNLNEKKRRVGAAHNIRQ